MTKRSATARPYPIRVPRVPVGPLAPTVVGECSTWLSMKGYSAGSAAGVLNALARLSLWMRSVGAGVEDIDEELLTRFVEAERSRDVVCVTAIRATGSMRRFLVANGYLGGASAEDSDPMSAAVAEWRCWMRDQRGLTEKTIAARVGYAADLWER